MNRYDWLAFGMLLLSAIAGLWAVQIASSSMAPCVQAVLDRDRDALPTCLHGQIASARVQAP